MQYEHFINYVKESFQKTMGPDIPVDIHSVLKTNSVRLDALTISPRGELVTPTIYLNDFYRQYQNGKPMDQIICEIGEIYESSRGSLHINAESILNFSHARTLIAYKLIHYEDNRELLETIPHIPYLDLAIVFYLLLNSDMTGDATALVTNEHMKLWNTTTDALYELARYNTPRMLESCFMSLEDLMKTLIIEDLRQEALIYKEREQISDEGMLSDKTLELMAEDLLAQYTDDSTPLDMHVLTNQNRCNGAAALLYPQALNMAADLLGGDFYILPSSIHEVILLPADPDINESALLSMVRDINANDVIPTERLSNTVYYCDAESLTLRCILD